MFANFNYCKQAHNPLPEDSLLSVDVIVECDSAEDALSIAKSMGILTTGCTEHTKCNDSPWQFYQEDNEDFTLTPQVSGYDLTDIKNLRYNLYSEDGVCPITVFYKNGCIERYVFFSNYSKLAQKKQELPADLSFVCSADHGEILAMKTLREPYLDLGTES